MTNLYVNSGEARGNFGRVRNWLKDRAPGVKFIIQPFMSFIEVELDAAKESYIFDFYQSNIGALRPTEIRVNRNDLFFINKIGLQIYKQDALTDPANPNYNYPIFTYPDPTYFDGDDGVNVPEWQALLNVYDGQIDINTDPVKRIENLSTKYFLEVPPNQQVLDPNAAAPAPGLNNESFPAWNNDSGLLDLGYSFIIDGSENNNARLTLGEGNRSQIAGLVDSAAASVNTRNVLRLVLKGYKVNNAATKVNRWTEETV